MTHKKKNVLVVDDSLTVRLYHRHLIEQIDMNVEEAANGFEGLEKLLGEEFNLVLVDINMPKMDGYTMVTKMRDIAANDSTPVIMISTEAEAADMDKAYIAGANLYLTKPARPDVLSTIVSMLTGLERQ
jgi:two-component system chemotaxis response regulator CheY